MSTFTMKDAQGILNNQIEPTMAVMGRRKVIQFCDKPETHSYELHSERGKLKVLTDVPL